MNVLRRYFSVGCFVVCFSSFVGCLLWLTAQRMYRPVIACERPELFLGAVAPDKVIKCSFDILNKGRKPLRVIEVSPSCGSCTKIIDFPSHKILSGMKAPINVLFDPANLRGAVTKVVLVRSDDPVHPFFALSIHAQIRDPANTDDNLEPTTRDISTDVNVLQVSK